MGPSTGHLWIRSWHRAGRTGWHKGCSQWTGSCHSPLPTCFHATMYNVILTRRSEYSFWGYLKLILTFQLFMIYITVNDSLSFHSYKTSLTQTISFCFLFKCTFQCPLPSSQGTQDLMVSSSCAVLYHPNLSQQRGSQGQRLWGHFRRHFWHPSNMPRYIWLVLCSQTHKISFSSS